MTGILIRRKRFEDMKQTPISPYDNTGKDWSFAATRQETPGLLAITRNLKRRGSTFP